MRPRQAVLLSFLRFAGSEAEKLKLVKWAFLFGAEQTSIPSSHKFDFVPYQWGPFSFSLYHELRKMEEAGFIAMNDDRVVLTEVGQGEADQGEISGTRETIERYGDWSMDRLLDHVYARYEWFRLNSVRPGVAKPKRPKAKLAIYSIGYEGLSLDGLLNTLLEKGIQRLIDVRANPVARRYGFHKSTLERAAAGVGIDYVHVPEVGVPSDWRQELDSVIAYTKLFRKYRKVVLSAEETAVSTIGRLIQEKPSALMCKEADPACCHRTSLAERLADTTGLSVLDLRETQDALF